MRALAVLVMAVFVLSGCLDHGRAQEAAPAAVGGERLSDSSGPAGSTFTLKESYDRTITGLDVTVYGGEFESNCLRIPGPFQGMTGNVTLVWKSQTPLTDKLHGVIDLRGGPREDVQGASPLVVPLKNWSTDRSEWFSGLFISAQPPEPGAAVNQPFEVKVDLRYRGNADAEVETTWTCSG